MIVTPKDSLTCTAEMDAMAIRYVELQKKLVSFKMVGEDNQKMSKMRLAHQS